MIKVTVLYPSKLNSKFDEVYYCDKHIPMVKQLLGPALKSILVERGLSGEVPGSPPPYRAIAHLSFESVEVFYQAFGPHDAVITQDIANYTNIEPIVQISEVRIEA